MDSDDFTAAQMDDFEGGIRDYWQNPLYANNVPVVISIWRAAECDPDVIEVVRAPNVGGGGLTTTTPNLRGDAKIEIDTEFSNTSEGWAWLGAHEFGHVLDFDNVDASCGSGSVMATPGTVGGISNGLRCADATAFGRRWGSTVDPDYYEPSQYEEDCYDYYYVRETYCNYGNRWYLCNYVRYYLFTDCSPPI